MKTSHAVPKNQNGTSGDVPKGLDFQYCELVVKLMMGITTTEHANAAKVLHFNC